MNQPIQFLLNLFSKILAYYISRSVYPHILLWNALKAKPAFLGTLTSLRQSQLFCKKSEFFCLLFSQLRKLRGYRKYYPEG